MKNLKCATLMETLVAMVVASVVFGIAFSVYLQVTASSTTGIKMKAFSAVEGVVASTREEKRYFDESFQEGTVLIEKFVQASSLHPELLHVKIVATDDKGKVIVLRNILMPID